VGYFIILFLISTQSHNLFKNKGLVIIQQGLKISQV